MGLVKCEKHGWQKRVGCCEHIMSGSSAYEECVFLKNEYIDIGIILSALCHKCFEKYNEFKNNIPIFEFKGMCILCLSEHGIHISNEYFPVDPDTISLMES